MAKKKLSKKKRRRRMIRRLILLTILLALVTVLAVLSPKIIKVIKLAQDAKQIVAASTVDTFREAGTTVIYDAEGNELCTMRESKDMYYVDISQIPEGLQDAFVVMEDKDFYKHKGIDFKAIIRAIIANTENDEIVQGASTITQQLAKQLFSEKAHNKIERLLQKPIEWVIAIKLERYFTKEDIITMYLNYFDFLHNAVGIKRASNVYFAKEPHRLSLTESATLIGLCKNPSLFNPLKYPERCLERRNVVLGQMVKSGYLTQAEYDHYAAMPLDVE